MRWVGGVLTLFLAVHCATGGGADRGNPGSRPGAGGTSNILLDGGNNNPRSDSGPPVDTTGCGDGVLQPAKGEVCDDGNSTARDGCSADCKVVEQNFACPVPGAPCLSTVVCGDRRVTGAETCDDGNMNALDGCDAECHVERGYDCPTAGERCQAARCGDGVIAGVEQCEDDDATPTSGDGCSATCQLEPGWVCATPVQACRRAVCGDGVAEGGEPCDDGNTVMGDGCSPLCEAEPNCTKPVDPDGCTSKCGDGLLLAGDNEQCDDGNTRAGDGCSATCQVEPGYECRRMSGTLPNTLSIPFIFRDFIALPSSASVRRHPDFQSRCVNQQNDAMVDATLSADGKPANSGSCNLAANCALDLGPVNQAADHCLSHETCPAGFDGCDQLHALHPLASHPGQDPFSFWYRDTPGVNKTKVVNTTLTLLNGAYQFSSNNLYPLDGDGWVASGEEVSWNGHNYGFTTEVRRWFEFRGGELLTFHGDDDVWVFINGRLMLDIGGLHGTETRTIRLNANGIVDCKIGEPGVFDNLVNCRTPNRDSGIRVGSVYEIALFHAERHSLASNFRLSMTGFVSERSTCAAVCGDAVVTPGEDCDHGAANAPDAYGGCTTQCKRGPHCGDAVVQTPQEACDDGTNLSPYSTTAPPGCAPGCKLGAYCGDGQIDSLFGEECDDGANNGGYAGCQPNCTLGTRCGDGVVQAPETCDDGDQVSGDGCSSICQTEVPR